jgi:hypothetical protein
MPVIDRSNTSIRGRIAGITTGCLVLLVTAFAWSLNHRVHFSLGTCVIALGGQRSAGASLGTGFYYCDNAMEFDLDRPDTQTWAVRSRAWTYALTVIRARSK